MKRLLSAAAVSLAISPAQAEGFAIKDLSQVSTDATSALGDRFVHRAAPQRLILTCPTCEGAPALDILLGRQADGTEERFRSGQTTVARLEELCKAKSPECTIRALDVAPAVGWISAYPLGGAMSGSTAVILRDGDLLTVRSIASDGAVARRNAETIVKAVAPKIIGR